MNYLNEIKNFLKELTIDLYNVRAEDLSPDEFPSHYFNMGYTIKRIEEAGSMEDIINDIRMGRYEDIGFFCTTGQGDQPAVELPLRGLLLILRKC